MSIQSEATIADLLQADGKAELVARELLMMSPSGGLPGVAAKRILFSLDRYAAEHSGGEAFGDNVGYVVDLPNRKSFSPDASFYRGPLSMRFNQGAPLFAVEIRSEGDYGPAAERAMADKRSDYFAAGTLVVWDVDLMSNGPVRVYRSDNQSPFIFRRGEMADAEPALPGWRMPVDELFFESSG